jgi:hypothetical protein
VGRGDHPNCRGVAGEFNKSSTREQHYRRPGCQLPCDSVENGTFAFSGNQKACTRPAFFAWHGVRALLCNEFISFVSRKKKGLHQGDLHETNRRARLRPLRNRLHSFRSGDAFSTAVKCFSIRINGRQGLGAAVIL